MMGKAGTGAAKARSPEHCRAAQKLAVEARRRNKHISIGRDIAQAASEAVLRREKRRARRAKSVANKRGGK